MRILPFFLFVATTRITHVRQRGDGRGSTPLPRCTCSRMIDQIRPIKSHGVGDARWHILLLSETKDGPAVKRMDDSTEQSNKDGHTILCP